MVSDNVFVTIPTALVLHAAGINLDKANAALDHATSHEALGGEVAAMFLVETIEVFEVIGFALDIERFRRGGLHAIGEFITLDAGVQFTFGGGLGEVLAVQLCEKVELCALGGIVEAGWELQIIDRITFRSKPRSLVDTGQKSSTPIAGVAFGKTAIEWIAH